MLDLVVVDDSSQEKPSRPGLASLHGFGGVFVPGSSAAALEARLFELKERSSFPSDPTAGEFKWSPGRGVWMRDGLVEEERFRFHNSVINLMIESRCEAFVVLHEGHSNWPLIWRDAAVKAHQLMADKATTGLLLADMPGGGKTAAFLGTCYDCLGPAPAPSGRHGIATSAVVAESRHTGLLQLADFVTGAVLSVFAGESGFAPRVFCAISRLFPARDGDAIGERCVLLRPMELVNLYHWLLGDSWVWLDGARISLPSPAYPYFKSPTSP